MPRTPYEITIGENWTRTWIANKNPPVITTGRAGGAYAKESAVGVSGRKPEGFVPPTPYHFQKDRIDNGDGVWNFTQVSGFERYNTIVRGNVFGYDAGVGPFSRISNSYYPKGTSQKMEDQALTKARLAIKSKKVDLGVAFFEASKTAQMVGDTTIKLAKFMMALKSGRFKQAMRQLGVQNAKAPRGSSVTNMWLESQYGWLPLLQDIHGAVDALARRDAFHWRVTGKGSVRNNYSEGPRYIGGTSEPSYGRGGGKGWTGVFVRIDAVPGNNLLQAFSSLGITNPGTVAWELVPYSFVVDWFLPIGSFLDQVDAMLGFDSAVCSISHFEKFESYFELQSTSWKSSSTDSYDHQRRGQSTRRYVSLHRYVPADVPMPRLPRLKNPVSLKHMANGLSLLASAFSHR